MDRIQRYLAAIQALRPQLPALLGDAWPAFQQELDDYLARLARSADAEEQQRILGEIDLLFYDHPAADDAFQETLHSQASATLPAALGFEYAAATPAVKGIEPQATPGDQPGTVTRYTDISCPERVWIGAPRITAVVRLALLPPAYSADIQELALRTDLPVLVRVSAPKFSILNGAEREMTVFSDRDSEIAVDLKPSALGATSITFDFIQGGNPVGTAGVQVEIIAEAVAQSADAHVARPLRFDPGATAPDLLLYVGYEYLDGLPRFIFTLYRAGEGPGETFPPVPVRTSPRAYARDLYATLEGLTLSGESAGILGDEIKQIGQNLWRDLIPDRLRRLFLDNRDAWGAQTMLLVSDEPDIPWELVWPYDPRTGRDDEAPWAQTLNLTRWLRRDAVSSGYDGPASTLRLSALACLAPADPTLPSAAAERTFLETIMKRYALDNVTPPSLRKQAVLDLLRGGGYSWLHVATHGDFARGDPARGDLAAANPDRDAPIWLEGADFLAPQNIVGGQIERYIYANRPGFVFNACYSGQGAWALTRLGGWANRLVGAGAGLFLAPLWTVRDDLALAFSEAFYAELVGGKTVAEAMGAGRHAANQEGDPTWLAYSVYAHPNARVMLSQR